jgi:hypothetical protein
MKSNMTTLIILVHEPNNSREATDGIAAAICPYLGSFAEQATIATTERLRELRNGDETSCLTMLRLTLAGTARVEFSTLVARLAKFLKQTAKDAHIDARFEIFRLEQLGDKLTDNP